MKMNEWDLLSLLKMDKTDRYKVLDKILRDGESMFGTFFDEDEDEEKET